MRHSRLHRGLKADLPSSLSYGEVYFCTDTLQVYLGLANNSVVEVRDKQVLQEISNIKGDITSKNNDLISKINALTTTVNNNKSDGDNKHNALAQTVADNKTAIDNKVNDLTGVVNANKSAIEHTVSELTGTVNANKTDANNKINALTGTVNANKSDADNKHNSLTQTVTDNRAYGERTYVKRADYLNRDIDFNNVTTPGMYYVIGGNHANKPPTLANGKGGMLIISSYATNTKGIIQTFTDEVHGVTSTRVLPYGASTWGSWNTHYSVNSKPTPNDLGAYTKNEVDTRDTNTLNSAKSYTNSEVAKKLSLTGGTLTGKLKVVAENGQIEAQKGDNIAVFGTSATTGEYLFGGRLSSYTNDFVQTYMRIGTNKLQYFNGSSTYDIYHTGHKPSASDVGARPASWVPSWNDVTGKPSTFPPSSHNHDSAYLGKTATATNSDKLFGYGQYTGRTQRGSFGIPVVGSDGVMEIGQYLDFHLGNNNNDYDARLQMSGDTQSLVFNDKKVLLKGQAVPSDIGASPSNHNHDSAYLGKTAKAESAKVADSVAWNNVSGRPTELKDFGAEITNSSDINTTNSDKVWGLRSGSTTSNRPRDWVTIMNLGVVGGNSNGQLAWNYDGAELDLRFRNRHDTDGNYGAWRQIYHTGFKPSWNDIQGKPSTFTPSSHTHPYLPYTHYTTVQDLNNLKTSGVYSIQVANNTNAPTTHNGIVIVNFDVGTPFQIWIPDSNNIFYKRTYNYSNNTWGGWSNTLSLDIQGNSSTATKLQTARSINGTNFDGTGNITTSYWGTARNIQIGNTTKSVNGSSNVSWSLSEIGASPSNHNHDGVYVKGSNIALSVSNDVLNSSALSTSRKQLIAGSTDKVYVGNTSAKLILETSETPQVRMSDNYYPIYHTGNKPSWNDVQGKPSTFAPSSHDHPYLAWGNNLIDCRQPNDFAGLAKPNNVNIETWYGFSITNRCASDIPAGGVAFSVNARNGMVWTKGDIYARGDQRVYHTGFKPSPSDIGASPSNHNHNGTYLKQVVGATNESYVLDKKFIEIGDSSTKVHVGRGSTDVYVQNTVSNKYFALKDDGRLLYNDMNVTLDDPNTVLWKGYHHMAKSETVTPSKLLNKCSRGWVLVWSDWDDGVAGGNNYNINYSYIPKNTMFNTGTNTCFALSCGESSNAFANKTLYIFNDRITGHDSNKDKANNPNSYDIVLRAVLEY